MTNDKSTAVPPWPFFVRPALEVLEEHNVVSKKDIVRLIEDRYLASPDARSAELPSGMKVSVHRIGWTLSHITKAGWAVRPSKGFYTITEAGKNWLESNRNTNLTYTEANKIFRQFWPQRKTSGEISSVDSHDLEIDLEPPAESIEKGIALLTSQTEDELLARLRASDPSFFEKAVIKLLLAMGYGGAEKRGQQIGGSGDGGVDGVIDQDALGLEKIYVQAKRYAENNSIGSATIREFIGALAIKGVSSGVFITTSNFTESARRTAESPSHSIALIDGERLTSLMVKYKVGIQTKQIYEVVELDEEFFDDTDM